MASRVQPITGGTLWQNEEKHAGMSFIFQYRFAVGSAPGRISHGTTPRCFALRSVFPVERSDRYRNRYGAYVLAACRERPRDDGPGPRPRYGVAATIDRIDFIRPVISSAA